MHKLPMKMAILKTIVGRGPVSAPEIVRALEPDYGHERQFTPRAVENHLLALRAVGLIAEVFTPGPSGEESAAFIPTRSAIEKMAKYTSKP
jgi:hypothetical protein